MNLPNNIIKTIAPIAIEDLKKYFLDKSITYNIDYTNSKLKSSKLLTYISNLDIPCDITFNDKNELEELLKEYLNSSVLCSIPSLEIETINLLLEYKEIGTKTNPILYKNFIEDNLEIIKKWESKLESLTLYNMYIVNSPEMQEFAKGFPEDDTEELTGINFLSLLKHEPFYIYYSKVKESNLKFYTKYFNEYMFRGKNLYSYWATENNPLFLMTFGISEGLQLKENKEEESNVTPI
jgi:hypothetical protein